MSATAPVLTERSFLYDRNGEPQAVILPWKVYTEVAETFGWDLSEAEEADLRQAMRDSNEGNQDAFISMEDLE